MTENELLGSSGEDELVWLTTFEGEPPGSLVERGLANEDGLTAKGRVEVSAVRTGSGGLKVV